MFRMGSHVSLAAALATALLTVPVTASAASVPAAKSVMAESRCSEYGTFTLYTYYSSGSYSTIVGQGELTCEGDFVMHSGVQTQWFRSKTAQCPT